MCTRFSGNFLPEHVGIPMGGSLGSKYYMLEIHYDNPGAKRSKLYNIKHVKKRVCI